VHLFRLEYIINRISKFLSRENLLTVIHAFVTSRLDYCNGLLYGYAAARLVTSTRKYDHITPILRELHWLPVKFRIHFKLLLLTFKGLHGMAPKYMVDLLVVKVEGNYLLRFNDSIMLEFPKDKFLRSFGYRSFTVAAPKLWNELPKEIRDISSISVFKNRIKICPDLHKLRL
jgi:hypothetical protein